jgi:hypothetical protein
MSIYQVKTFTDMVTAVREELRVQSGDTETIKRIKRDLNSVYLQEVVPFHRWRWLNGSVDLSLAASIETGTASVTQDSQSITLSSAPTHSQKGAWFSVAGRNERYRILSHTAGATAVILSAPYGEDTDSAASYTIWKDAAALPVDCRETVEVTHDYLNAPLEAVGRQEFRKRCNGNPKVEDRPSCYYTSDPVDPSSYSTIASLPALSTRASDGLIRTLVFATTVAAYLAEGDRIEITAAGSNDYNGEWIVASVSTTTVTFVARTPKTESATADATLVVKLLNTRGSSETYRELNYYPAVFEDRITLHVDYIKNPVPMEDDTDEPMIPIEDRMVLVYGARALSWDREGNSAMAAKNDSRFANKLARMSGKLEDSTDRPVLAVSKTYLKSKRRRGR